MKSAARVLMGLILVSMAASAQDAPEITRADLAISLLRFEMAVKHAALEGERLAEVNRAFDTATLAFFQQKYGDAIRDIDALAIGMMSEINQDAAKKAAAVRVALNPPVFDRTSGGSPSIECTVLYPPGPAGTVVETTIAIIAPDGSVVGGTRPRIVSSGAAGDTHTIAESIDFAALAPGRYAFLLVPGGVHDADTPGKSLVSSSFLVTEGSLDAVREANAARIAGLTARDEKLAHAIAAVTGRNGLLSDTLDPSNTAQLMLDLTSIARQVDAEISAIANGVDPYVELAGDYWRTIKSPVKDFPVRVYLPATADTSKPLELVIAFHGAGGDENMFMDAYGVGAIKAVADAHGFLLVTPLTYAFNANMGAQFDALIEALGHDYAFDRIYAVGHSMGGGATANLLNERGNRLTAAASLCGFRGLDATKPIPPTLVVAAELDPIVSPARIEPAAQEAIAAGLPVEYRLIPDYGHTVIVGDYIDDAIAWMLEQTR